MSKTTRATLALTQLGISFTLHSYDYDPPRVTRPLRGEVDGKPVCVVVPSDSEVSMKKLAAAFGGKAAKMMRPTDAERLTGYRVGGISPFGQKKKVATVIEETALSQPKGFLNGGQRGLQIELDPNDACKALQAIARHPTA